MPTVNNNEPVHIIHIDDLNSGLEQRYKALKELIIRSMQARQGTYLVDFGEASDLAWDLANELPDNVALSKPSPEPEQPEEPSWLITLGICAIVIAIVVFILVMTGQL